jgi:hypothetical protein
MSSDSQGSSAVETAATSQPQELGPLQVQLVNWPLRDHPKRSVCLILITTLTSLLAGMMAESFSMGLLVWTALAIASWRYWLPVHYEIGPYGIRQTVWKHVRRVSWQQVGRLEFRQHGIRFFPDHDPAQLANLRGLYVYHSGKEETLKQVVTFYLDSTQPAGSSSRPTVH